MWLLLLVSIGCVDPTTESADSAGVADPDWMATIGARIDAGQYRFRPHGDVYAASNPAHGLHVTAMPDGLHFEEAGGYDFALRLARWGAPGALVPAEPAAWSEGACASDARLDEAGKCLPRLIGRRGSVEEYAENRVDGVEQGWTFEQAVAGALMVEVAVDGASVVSVEGDRVVLRTPGGTVRYDQLAVYDAKGRTLAASFEPLSGGVRIAVETDGAVWPVTVDPRITTGWVGEGDASSVYYGWAVANAGDVDADGFDDILVGAYAYDNGSTDEGRAFLYLGSTEGPSTTADWTAEPNQSSAYFGYSLDGAGDVNDDGYDDVVIGAYLYDNGNTDEGRAHVYYGSATGLAATPGWTAEANQTTAYFGFSVAGAGDVNNDQYDDVIVGAYMYDNGTTDEGAAMLYLGDAGGLATSAVWTGEGGQASSRYGWDVAGLGDVDLDGYDDVGVGATHYDDGQTDEGEVFIYYGLPSGILGTPDTIDSDQSYAYGGYSIDGAGDVDGDGYADVIFGAYAYDNGTTDEGKVWVHHGSVGGVETTSSWSAESGSSAGYMGINVTSAGDVDNDGYDDVLVGASGYTYSLAGGAAFVYPGSASGLSTTASYSRYGDQSSAALGRGLAGGMDVDADGFDDVLIGAPSYTRGSSAEGTAVLAYGGASGLRSDEPWEWSYSYPGSSDYTGYAVAGGIDGDGDGNDEIAVGVYSNYYVYTFEGGTSGLSATAAASVYITSNYAYGKNIVAIGDSNGINSYEELAVGAYTYGSYDYGAVYVYTGRSSNFSSGSSSYYTILSPATTTNAYFGWDMDAAGDVNGDGYADMIVGAYGDTNGEYLEGSTWVFYGRSSGYSSSSSSYYWKWDSDQDSARSGYAVAGVGDVDGDGYDDVAITAPYYDDGENEEGAVFVFYGGSSGPSTTPDWQYLPNVASQYYGQAVRGIGDVDGDGYSDFAVRTNSNTLDIFYGSAAGPSGSPDLTLSDGGTTEGYAQSFAALGDVNADGYDDFAVGAYKDDNGQTDEGVVNVFLGAVGGISEAPDYQFEVDRASAYFGYSVASAGDIDNDGDDEMVVGAYTLSDSYTNQGRVYVYDFTDEDGDGAFLWVDCDDDEPAVYDDATELCDGLDNDCDGVIDDETPVWYLDLDADGYGDPAYSTVSCTQPSGYVANDDDCDDADEDKSPLGVEVCNGADDDCDGSTDEAGATGGTTYYLDTDADGYGVSTATVSRCSLPSGYSAVSTDCDDGASGTYPGADEYCDGDDNDCDGTTDENTAVDVATWYRDSDSDAYGDPSVTTPSCTRPSGYVSNDDDCNDADATVSPADVEVCDLEDDDCDGTVDDGVASTFYADTDGDDYGTTTSTTAACSAPTGYVGNDDDCDDGDAAISPVGTESCNLADDDCDGATDERGSVGEPTWYLDYDGDGFGGAAGTIAACNRPGGYSATDDDCDDRDAAVYPLADEYCNGDDDDCDGDTDESDAVDADTWYRDADDDGYGDPAETTASCSEPDGYLNNDNDCDDTTSAVSPAVDEIWYDGFDQDCAEDSDFDQDGDGLDSDEYGGTDCEDTNDRAYPGAREIWYDGFDGDCDGSSDYDQDGDGQDTESYGGDDCDDEDANVYLGAPDTPYDGVIMDCDGTYENDADHDGEDGFGHGGVDCDDDDASVYPGAEEIWYDGIDQDCDLADDYDQDGDGTQQADDCDDTDPVYAAECPEPEDTGSPATDKATGCAGCATGDVSPAWLGLLVGGVAVRRRRRG